VSDYRAAPQPLPDLEWLDDMLEEIGDIQAYDRAKAGPEEAIPFEQAVRESERPRSKLRGIKCKKAKTAAPGVVFYSLC
jgi:hypothetical protein